MAVKFNSAKCPECGASLPVEEGRTQIFCSYCGAKILITNENEYIYRHIDEAAVKQAETNRIVELKRLEMAEKKREAKRKKAKLKILISLVLAIVGVLMLVKGNVESVRLSGYILIMVIALIWLLPTNEDNDDDDYDGKVKVPYGVADFERKSYVAIEAIFKSAGFTNIQCVPLNDLTFGLFKKPDMVESITINGKNITSGGKKFSPDATVVISYHSIS